MSTVEPADIQGYLTALRPFFLQTDCEPRVGIAHKLQDSVCAQETHVYDGTLWSEPKDLALNAWKHQALLVCYLLPCPALNL